MKLAKQLTILFTILSLNLNCTIAFAQSQPTNIPISNSGTVNHSITGYADYINDMNDGQVDGINKTLARPLTRYILRKAGTPGFMFSKFMNFRKQINKPICTLSQKLAFASFMLLTIGDIANHVVALKNSKDLKKEFSAKMDLINASLAEESTLKKNLDSKTIPNQSNTIVYSTDATNTAVEDPQIMALNYLIAKEEKDLKRQILIAKFVYPGLALQLASNLLNANELFMEGTSFGTYLAQVNACQTAQKPVEAGKEVAVNAKATAEAVKAKADAERIANDSKIAEKKNELKSDDTPWYVKPFLWLALKFDEPVMAINTFRKGMGETGTNAKEYMVAAKGGSIVNAIAPLQSAVYAEEMLVKTIMILKGGSFGSVIKDEAFNIGLRYAVRALIKTNIVAVDGFMRSAVGRFVIFAFNLWVIYTEFDNTRDRIEDSKNKIAFLKEYRAKVSKLVTINDTKNVEPLNANKIFKEIISYIMIPTAHAGQEKIDIDSSNFSNIRLCISDYDCNNKLDLVNDQNVMNIFSTLPKQMQEDQFSFIKKSYSANQVAALMRGEISPDQINLNAVQKEIDEKSNELNAIYSQLKKKGKITDEALWKAEYSMMMNDYNVYSKYMRKDFNKYQFSPVDNDSAPILDLSIDKSKNPMPSLATGPVTTSSTNLVAKNDAPAEGMNQETPTIEKPIKSSGFKIEYIHRKEQSIFEIIHHRYQNRFSEQFE